MENSHTQKFVTGVTVLIATRNRGDGLIPTLESLFENDHPNFNIIVVDQSAGNETHLAIMPYLTRDNFTYIPTASSGRGLANNIGLQQAKTDIVVLTDDDCTVPKDWIRAMEETFKIDPKIAVVFCNVDQGDHDPQKGFIPAYYRKNSKLVTTMMEKCKANGIGAGMAVRREAVQRMGGFDDMLGVGARFASGAETDLSIRALLFGYYVYETNATSVLHFGFRTFEQGKAMTVRKWFGTGAALAKPLKCGHWKFWIVPVNMLIAFAIRPMIQDILQRRKPRGAKKIPAFLRGFLHGWRTPIDPRTICFLSHTASS